MNWGRWETGVFENVLAFVWSFLFLGGFFVCYVALLGKKFLYCFLTKMFQNCFEISSLNFPTWWQHPHPVRFLWFWQCGFGFSVWFAFGFLFAVQHFFFFLMATFSVVTYLASVVSVCLRAEWKHVSWLDCAFPSFFYCSLHSSEITAIIKLTKYCRHNLEICF